jgi:hypothetical protein
MKQFLSAAAVIGLFAVLPASAALAPITASQSLQNIGQCVAVEGVASVRPDPQRFGTDVDIDGEHSSFLGFIPKGNEAQFPQLASLNGQQIRITGVVHTYLGRGEVSLADAAQVVPAKGMSDSDSSTHVGAEFARHGSPGGACN